MELDDLDFEKLQKIDEKMRELGKPYSLNPSDGFRSQRTLTVEKAQVQAPVTHDNRSAAKNDYIELDLNK